MAAKEEAEMVLLKTYLPAELDEEELKAVYPHSRERLICKHCNHTLSVCSAFLEATE